MRTSGRWLVPVAVAATIAGGVAVGSAQADSAPALPQRSPEQVLAAVADARVTALSGTVVTRTDLGLPAAALPGGSGGGLSATDGQGLVTRFLTGRNTLRVWVDGPARQRVQVLDPFDELNVVRNGTQLWTYSARRNEVTKGTLPADGAKSPAASGPSAATDVTPAELARRAIAAADPTTSVTLATPGVVAGRATYSLTLTPKTERTLVDRVVIAVDAGTGVPLQVEVYARGYRLPAVESGFTSVSFTRPAAATFSFTPPKGATVTDLGSADTGTPRKPPTGRPAQEPGPRPELTGTGWAAIVELPAASSGKPPAAGPRSSADGDQAEALLDQLTEEVDGGGRALSTRLLSVLLTPDGRVLAGAVPVQSLVEAAAR